MSIQDIPEIHIFFYFYILRIYAYQIQIDIFFFQYRKFRKTCICIENTSKYFILKVTQRDPQVSFYQPTLKLFFHPAVRRSHLETEIQFAWQIHWINVKKKIKLF